MMYGQQNVKFECCGDLSSEMCESKPLSIIQFCFQIQTYKRWTVNEVSCLEVNQQKLFLLRSFHDGKVETMPLKTTEPMEETITEWQQDKCYEW